MKIAVIFTGGTIGSLTKREWVGIDASAKYMLLEGYTKGDVQFETFAPYSILSENLSAEELNRLQEEIEAVLATRPDGIIVTHGTDTLLYSAAAAELAFGDAPVPVVFVSADYPLDHSQTNGHANFEAAVALIQSRKAKGVFVSYKNANEAPTRIHLASRLLRHGEISAELYSIAQSELAFYENGELRFMRECPDVSKALGRVEYSEHSGILSIDSEPGNSYAYSLEGVRALLLRPYHSATLNTASRELAQLCQKAKEKGIPVFLHGVKKGVAYESTKLFDGLGLVVAPFGSYVSLYMKLWAAFSTGRDPVAFVQSLVANEWVE